MNPVLEVRNRFPHASVITAEFGTKLKYRIENRIKKRNNLALSAWKSSADEAWLDAMNKINNPPSPPASTPK